MQKTEQSVRVLKYGLTGGVAFLVEYSSFLLITTLLPEQSLIFAQTISFCLGLVTSFTGSRLFTFKHKTESFRHTRNTQIVSYFMLALVNLVLTNLLIHILTNQIGVVVWAAKVITMMSVVVWNYLIFSKFIFKTN